MARGAVCIRRGRGVSAAGRGCDDLPVSTSSEPAPGGRPSNTATPAPWPQSGDRPQSGDDIVQTLYDAAFGASPAVHPLPGARSVPSAWLRAVALGGQGHYSAARAELTRVHRITGGDGVWASLAASTEASLLRQLGWHRVAAGHDGRALAVLAGSGTRPGKAALRVGAALRVEAEADAITGLAADALGCGRTAVARRLLDRCDDLLATARAEVADNDFPRQRIRLAWVGAETALASGDFPAARRFAARAADAADRFGSVRHRVKSDLLCAAALTDATDPGPARELAEEVGARAEHHGLIPLRWAATMLLTGLGAGRGAAEARDRCAALLRHRGATFAAAGTPSGP